MVEERWIVDEASHLRPVTHDRRECQAYVEANCGRWLTELIDPASCTYPNVEKLQVRI